jgi:cytoskeletal protein RodZ
VSIGETLADARRQAGLTVMQVADRTRIRETIIRGIEQDDFSACGGDFYTRGHIRSIASVVGIDPVPLIREYDEAHGAPEAMRAADVFEPSTPLRIKERRSLNWSVAMILALLVIVGYGAYHLVTSSSSSHGKATAAAFPAASRSATPRPNSPSPTPTRTAAPSNDVIIQLTAVEDCWVFLTSDQGNNTIYSGVVPAGSTQTWKETKAVSLRLGNPAGVVLTVNGKKQSPGTSQPITLTLGPGREVSAQPGPGNAS